MVIKNGRRQRFGSVRNFLPRRTLDIDSNLKMTIRTDSRMPLSADRILHPKVFLITTLNKDQDKAYSKARTYISRPIQLLQD